jgi:flagellar basal body-associated protein FliL
MKKKIISIILISILSVTLIGCAVSKPVSTNTNENAKQEEIKKDEKKEPPLKIEQLPLDIKMREPDSIGNIYMDATYTNNTDKNIVGYTVTVLLKDSNKTTYLSDHDTILPSETSPKFNSAGPKSKSMDDVQILKYEINIANNDGTKTNIEYDNKLKQYKWMDLK